MKRIKETETDRLYDKKSIEIDLVSEEDMVVWSQEKLRNRFWKKVNKKGEDDCWEWEANKVKGYGKFWYNGKLCFAHRVAYILTYGKIPEDKPFICHRCDNPPCCNPNHLFPGTMQDNFDDKTNKGRSSGEYNSRAKLTWEDINEIRKIYNDGAKQEELGKQFGIHRAEIGSIIRNEHWKDSTYKRRRF